MICFSAHDFLYTLSLCWPLTAVVPSFFLFLFESLCGKFCLVWPSSGEVCVCVCRAGWCERERESDVYACQLSKAGLTYEHTARHKKTVENRLIREKSWWIIQDRSNESDSLWAHRPLVNLESLTLEIEMKKIQQTDRIGVSLHWDSLWHARRCDQKF